MSNYRLAILPHRFGYEKQYYMHTNTVIKEIKSVVITGPTGAIGTALCNLLTAKGIKVYASVRSNSNRSGHIKEIAGTEIVNCDLSQLKRLPEIIPSADAFFHLAWAKTVGQGRNDMYAQTDNLRYTLDAVHAAKALGCKVFVGAGSQAEYGRVNHALTPDTPCFPENGYGMAKLCAGQMSRLECRKLEIRHVWPRILSVYGPYDGTNTMVSMVIRFLLQKKNPALTAGEQIWDFLYSNDAAQALYLLALSGRDGEIYPLGNGHAKPLREYIKCLRDVIDPALPLGFGEIAYSPGQVMHLEADLHTLERDTGYVPDTSFEKGIRETVEWMKKNG